MAPVLVENGITAHQINEMAKDALVSEASARARMASGRVNHSKVAALTGLTRSEIRRRLLPDIDRSQMPSRALDRSARAVAGWLRDPAFHDAHGKPKPLAIRGSTLSFVDLVRRHSGDVPPRAVLETLKSRGIASINKGYVRLKHARLGTTRADISAFLESAPYASGLLRSASMPGSRLDYAHQLSLYPENATHELILTDRAVAILATAISALSVYPEAKKIRDSVSLGRRLAITVTLVSSAERIHGSKKESDTHAEGH